MKYSLNFDVCFLKEPAFKIIIGLSVNFEKKTNFNLERTFIQTIFASSILRFNSKLEQDRYQTGFMTVAMTLKYFRVKQN